jgi:hypothetical protein
MGYGGIFIGIGVLLGLPVAPEAPLVPPEVKAAFREHPVSLSAVTWPEMVGELSRQLGVPVVTWVPEQYHLHAYQGKTLEVLTQLAREQCGVWRGDQRLLLLVRALERLPTAPVTAKEIKQQHEQLRQHALPPYRLLLWLDEAQIQKLGRGEALKMGDLNTPQQRRLFRDLYLQRTFPFRSMKGSHKLKLVDIDEFHVYYSLSYWGTLFWRGQALGVGNWQPSRWRADPYWQDCRSLHRRDLGALRAQAKTIFREGTLVLETPVVFSLEALEKRLAPWLRDKAKKLKVSAQMASQQVAVSAGKWPIADLAAGVSLVTHMEWRALEELIFWGPTREAVRLDAMRELAHRCDLTWAVYLPIIQAWKNNPRNRALVTPYYKDPAKPRPPHLSYADFFPPRLVSWQFLTPTEKQLARFIFYSQRPTNDPKELARLETEIFGTYAADIEVNLYPGFLYECPVLSGYPPVSEGGGDIPYFYGWLVTRFGRQGQLPTVTPPLPRGEQK